VLKTGLGWMRRFEKCWVSQQNMCRQIWPVYESPKRVNEGFKVRKWSTSGYGWTAVQQVELADEKAWEGLGFEMDCALSSVE
jgi:hypothetical protein